MTVWTEIGCQLRHPRGVVGRAVGQLMRVVNARPNALAVATLDPQPGEDVLELGCGPGHAVALMVRQVPGVRIHALDQSAAMLAQARSRNRAAVRAGYVRLCRSRFTALPFPAGSMDKVLAVNVAYFWRDARAVLGEVRRVLRPGGRLAVYVTEAGAMRRWKFADAETHRLFDRDGLAGLLREGGFADAAVSMTRVPVAPGVAGLIATAVLPAAAPVRPAPRVTAPAGPLPPLPR